MGVKQSTANSPRSRAFSNAGMNSSAHGRTGATVSSTGGSEGGLGVLRTAGTSSGPDARQRAQSFSNVSNGHPAQPVSIPASSNGAYGRRASPDSEASSTSDRDDTPFGRLLAAHSLPTQLWTFNGIKCPVCSKFVIPDDVECHLVMCLTKPRINYNEDVLTEDKGECVICLDELLQGDTIARLPCLCIYHKGCIDGWFEVNRSCPEHPSD